MASIHLIDKQFLSHEAPTDSAKPTDPSTTEDSTTTKEDGSSTKTAPENTSSVVNFTTQQIELFSTRFMEGYDMYDDQEYVTWLQLTHPEAVPNSITTPPDGPSLLDEFSDVLPVDPVQWTTQLIINPHIQ